MECQESRQKTERGAVTARPRKRKLMTTISTTTKSKPQQQSASQSEQVQKIILRNPSRGQNREAGNSNRGTPGNGRGRKVARSKSALSLTK